MQNFQVLIVYTQVWQFIWTAAKTLQPYRSSPHWLTFTWWGCCGLCVWHKPTELAHSFALCTYVYFCLYGPFNSISFNKFSQQLSPFSLCSSSLKSALLVLSTIYLFMKVSFSPDIILCGWLGLKHQIPNYLTEIQLPFTYHFPWKGANVIKHVLVWSTTCIIYKLSLLQWMSVP